VAVLVYSKWGWALEENGSHQQKNFLAGQRAHQRSRVLGARGGRLGWGALPLTERQHKPAEPSLFLALQQPYRIKIL